MCFIWFGSSQIHGRPNKWEGEPINLVGSWPWGLGEAGCRVTGDYFVDGDGGSDDGCGGDYCAN